MAVRRTTLFLSLSKNIFENLAFEEWLLRNRLVDCQGESMLLWSNKPAVVIGRHQNPWLEADLKYLTENNIELARRHSGGGTVYHDLGNINISILTTQQNHNRKRNLQSLAQFLSQRYNINVEPSERDDLCLQPGKRKISGTAARIIRGTAYHHLTLLVQPDISKLKRALHSSIDETKISTNATRSVRAPAVGYLAEEVPDITVDEVMHSLGDFFKQQNTDTEMVTLPDVTDNTIFPGVHKNELELRDWKWIYGRTPKFDLELLEERMTVEGGVVTKCDKGGLHTKLIGTNLPVNLSQTTSSLKLPSLLGGVDFTPHVAKAKRYLKQTPKTVNPKSAALQATVLSTLFIALTLPVYGIFFGGE